MLRLNTLGGLWIEGGAAADEGGVRPRRLALLAILAVAGAKGVSRDRLLAVLWPESGADKARHALSQTLYSLRGDLGADPVLATASDLRLDPTLITTDLDVFRTAVTARDWTGAAAAYAGPFLDGFFLADAPEFERWAEDERSRLTREAVRALESAANALTGAGQLAASAELRRRLTELDPLSGRYAAAYMDVASRLGERAAALAHGRAHFARVRQELDAEPDPEVTRALEALRDAGAASAEAPVAADAAAAPPAPDRLHAGPGVPVPSGRRWKGAVAALLVVGVIGVGTWQALRGPRPAGPVLAVGQVRDLVTPDSAQLGGVLSEMLATSIGRLTTLQVMANSRILELIPPGTETLQSARTDAARRAGATEVLEGELIPLPDHRLRFDLRRVDLGRGLVRRAYQASGTDRMALFDSITVLIAADLGVAPPTRSLAEVSTRSPVAFRLYEEGLRAFHAFDPFTADRLFNAALAEDSTFAMATYYAWRSAKILGKGGHEALAARAMALASGASERDRLLIQTYIGMSRWDPATVPAAESLVMRFPNDPEALVRAAEVTNDLARATELLDRSIAIDSASGAGVLAVCRMCEAFFALKGRYDWADSVEATERTIRRWIRLRPGDPNPWGILADYVVGLDRRPEAEVALRQALALGGGNGNPDERRLTWSLRTDDVAGANEICRTQGVQSTSGDYRWLCTIALRMQGRYREAVALVGTGRASGSAQEPVLDLEMGRPSEALAIFARNSQAFARARDLAPGAQARDLTWSLTLEGTASAAAHDYERVRVLADSVEATGRRSLFPRDRLLHHFLRALLLAATDRHEDAVREFRAAMQSPSQGYTRINYELGRSLLALHRPAEAIAVLRAPLHGGLDGSGLYLTRTETHELLARAFDAAGQRDSAAAHFAIVTRAWRDADPSLALRRDAAQRYAAR